MADRASLIAALQAADAAGNVEDATALANALSSMGVEPAAAPAAAPKPTFADLPGNIIPSAVNLAKDIAQPIIHPIDTAKGVYKVATDAPTRAAVGQFYKDRYGGLENLHDTLIKDPVGMVSDLATLLTGGGALAAKLPGMAGKVGAITAKVGSAIDPIANAGRAAKVLAVGTDVPRFWTKVAPGEKATIHIPGASDAAANLIGGVNLAGADAMRAAASSGYKGTKAFKENMRDKVPAERVLDDVDDGIKRIRDSAQQDYRQQAGALVDVPIDTRPIHDQFATIMADTTSPGGVPLAKKVDPTDLAKIDKVKDAIDEVTTTKTKVWVKTDPNKVTVINGKPYKGGYPETRVEIKPVNLFELDALKQKLSRMYPEPGTRTPQVQRVISQVNDTIRAEIGAVDKNYLTMMEKYENAQVMLDDLRKTLSQTGKAQTDTQLMKLRKAFNETPQGKRTAKMIDKLEDATGKPIRAQMAGQMMQNWLPGGGRLIPTAAAKLGVGALGYGAASGALPSLPFALAGAAMASPRLMGETAYALGAGARMAEKGVLPSVATMRGASFVNRPLDDERVKRARQRAGVK